MEKIVNPVKNLIIQIKQKGFFHLLSANFLIQLVSFGSGLIVAGILTPKEVGDVRIIQTYIGVLVILAGLGLNSSTLKLVSEQHSIEHKVELFKVAFSFVVCTSIFVYSISVLFAKMGLLSSEPIIIKYFPVFAFTIPFFTVNSISTALLQGLKRIKELSYIQSTSKILSVVLIILLTWLFGIIGYGIAYVSGIMLTSFLLYYACRKLGVGFNRVFCKKDYFATLFKHWNLAKFAFLANSVGYLGTYVDIFLINYFISDREQVGYYSFAVTVLLAFRLITSTVQQITTPYFSEKMNDVKEWRRVLKKYKLLNLLLSICLLLIGWFLAPVAIDLVFVNKYSESYIFIKLLLVVWFIRNIYMLNGIGLYGLGLLNWNFYLSAGTFILNAISCLIFLNYYGIMGACYGLLPSSIIGFFVSNYMVKKAINLKLNETT